MADALEARMREAKRRLRRGETPDPAMEGARGLQSLLKGVSESGIWPLSSAQDVWRNQAAAPPPPQMPQNTMASQGPATPMPRPAAPATVPAQAPRPRTQGSAAPLQAGTFPQRGQAQAPAPLLPQAPQGASYGLEQYGQSEPTSNRFAEAFARSKAESQSPNLPTVASPGATGDPWQNVMPQSGAYTQFFGAPNPEFGPVTGGLSDYIGNVPRALINAPLGIAGALVGGLGTIPTAAAEGWRRATTSEGQVAAEDAAAAAASGEAAAAAEQKKTEYTLPQAAGSQYQPASPNVFPNRAPVQTAASWQQAQQGAQAPAQAPARAPGEATQQPGYGSPAPAPYVPQPTGDPILDRAEIVIGGQESGGQADSYRTLGPLITHNVNGQPTQDQALGKFGIMESNLPSWSQEAFGYPMTREEFLADPQAQHDLFRFKFGQYLQMGTPADAASRWISGQPLATAGNEADFWGSTAESYTRDFLSGMGMENLPTPEVAYEQGYGPAVPNPPDQVIPAAPDFSEQNRFFNQGAPTPPDANAQRQMLFNEILSGIAQGNANTDVRGPGGTGRLLAAWGSGAAQGRAAATEGARRDNEAFKLATQQYMMDRGRFAGDQARTEAEYGTQASQIQLQNEAADQLAQYQTDVQNFGVQEANKRAGFVADQTNRANLGQFLERARIAQQPTYDISAGGIVETLPGQPPHIREQFTRAGAGGSAAERAYYDWVDKARRGEYGPGPQYDLEFDEAAARGDEGGARQAILKAVIAGGYGKQVFGTWYDEQQALAAEQAREETGGGFDVKATAERADDILFANLWTKIAETGDQNWITNAAGMEIKGAKVYVNEAQRRAVESGQGTP